MVEAPVTSLAKFGAFIDLGDGIEGMIHIGDITAEKRLNHPNEALKQGETVKAVVLEADKERRRLRLGIKQLQPTSVDEYIAEHKPGDTVSGTNHGPVGDEGSRRARRRSGGTLQARPAEVGGNIRKCAQKPTFRRFPPCSRASGNRAADRRPRKALKVGQVVSCKISNLDAAQKRIELELA